MACSGIGGGERSTNTDTHLFVIERLRLKYSDTEASAYFTDHIKNSARSLFPTVNFVAHALAQTKLSALTGVRGDVHSLSFVPQIHKYVSFEF
jgi:hypothetical protein